jgi:AcrR family transcriptional regulator
MELVVLIFKPLSLNRYRSVHYSIKRLICAMVAAMNDVTDDDADPFAAPAQDRHLDRGVMAREQLIAHATRIFAAKGYVAATTREICDAAGVNVASIHYYFGDKEGLYRAALLQPIKEMTSAFGRFDDPSLPFDQAMRMFLGPFVAPSTGDLDRDVMRIHLREMMEPSDVFREITAQAIVPAHNQLATTLGRHCGLAEPDADIHQLAFAMVAMAHDYCMSRDFMKMLAPDVLERPRAMERILDRLVGYSRALLDYEIGRRRTEAIKERPSR